MPLLSINGKCHCGSVSFTAKIDSDKVMACHCEDCQVLSGAPFRAGVPAKVENFSLSGEVQSYIKISNSGNRRAQLFCGNCGTPLFSRAENDATSVMIRLGCVSERAHLAPVINIWKRSSLSWIGEIDNLPSAQKQEIYLRAEED
jgi:hypothetical protein